MWFFFFFFHVLKFEHAVVIVKKKTIFFPFYLCANVESCMQWLPPDCVGADCVFTLPELIYRCTMVVPFSKPEMTSIRSSGKKARRRSYRKPYGEPLLLTMILKVCS